MKSLSRSCGVFTRVGSCCWLMALPCDFTGSESRWKWSEHLHNRGSRFCFKSMVSSAVNLSEGAAAYCQISASIVPGMAALMEGWGYREPVKCHMWGWASVKRGSRGGYKSWQNTTAAFFNSLLLWVRGDQAPPAFLPVSSKLFFFFKSLHLLRMRMAASSAQRSSRPCKLLALVLVASLFGEYLKKRKRERLFGIQREEEGGSGGEVRAFWAPVLTLQTFQLLEY